MPRTISYSPAAIARKESAAMRSLVKAPAARPFPWFALALVAAVAIGAAFGLAL